MTAILAVCLLIPDRIFQDTLPPQVIRIVEYTDETVTLEFPNEYARRAFWVTFCDEFWPPGLRVGQEENFERTCGPWISGQNPSGLTATLMRGKPGCEFFDKHSPETARRLNRMGIDLEIIDFYTNETEVPIFERS